MLYVKKSWVVGVTGLLVSALAYGAAEAPRIDRAKVLFGVEYTFQDQVMVDEPGRNTMTTPHKEAKAQLFVENYLNELGLDESHHRIKTSWKPGHFVSVPGDGDHVLNTEPVTIEVNTTPRTLDQIEGAAESIFQAAEKTGLVPYVQPAAERSGMGHIHIGAATLGESPFYKNPQLLRNVLVYFHKHPSLLYGFAEAYDVGHNSNIETFHRPERQAEFRTAVQEFDQWYTHALANGDSVDDGLTQFLKILKRIDRASGFFQHYRAINLEHIERLTTQTLDPSTSGKFTVEFRGFRPQKSPAHAKADAELLLAVMEHLSRPGYVEPFEEISPEQFGRFFTGSKIAEDWRRVQVEIGRNHHLWDEMVNEYIQAIHTTHYPLPNVQGIANAQLLPAYSEKEKKGTRFELRIPARNTASPDLSLGGVPLSFEKVQLESGPYWVSYIEAEKYALTPDQIRTGQFQLQTGTAGSPCPQLYSKF